MWEHVSGDGLWQNWRNTKTNEESVKEHKLKLVKEWCPEGHHVYSNEVPPSRIIICTKCGQETKFIVGVHEFKAGRLILRNQ